GKDRRECALIRLRPDPAHEHEFALDMVRTVTPIGREARQILLVHRRAGRLIELRVWQRHRAAGKDRPAGVLVAPPYERRPDAFLEQLAEARALEGELQ